MSFLGEEVTNDPLGRGYNGPGSENLGPDPMTDQELVDSLNAVNRSRDRTSMTASEVLNAVDKTEWVALIDAERQQIWDILHMGEVNPFGIEADLFQDIFGGSTTITALQAIRVEAISRAQELGVGVVTLKILKLESIR